MLHHGDIRRENLIVLKVDLCIVGLKLLNEAEIRVAVEVFRFWRIVRLPLFKCRLSDRPSLHTPVEPSI